MANELRGRTVAFLVTDGVEQVELTEPWKAVGEAGAERHLVSLDAGTIQGVNNDTEKGDTFPVDRLVKDVSADDYDALVLPGGVANPDALRMDNDAVRFVKEFFVEKATLANGSTWDMELFPDQGETYIMNADGANNEVRTLVRDTGEVVGAFGRNGRQAGDFHWVHNIAIDSKGTIYTTEVDTGKRAQKFVLRGDMVLRKRTPQ